MAEPTEVAYWQAIGRRVAEARGRLGWTQERLGTEAGTTKNRITRLEGGEAVSEGVLASIAAHLGVSVAWLRYGIVVLSDSDRVRQDGFREGWTSAVAELRRFVEQLESALPAPNAVRPADSASGGAEIPMMHPDEFVADPGAAPTRRAASGEGRRARGSR